MKYRYVDSGVGIGTHGGIIHTVWIQYDIHFDAGDIYWLLETDNLYINI